jgi:hypothetical protein
MDLRRLRAGEWIAAAGGVTLLVSLFLHWYQGSTLCLAPEQCFGPAEYTGWESFAVVDLALALVALFAVSIWVITATQDTPAVAIAADAMLALFGVVATLLVVIRLIDPPGVEQHVSTSIGGFVALVGALGTTVGAGLAMRDERRSRPGEITDLTGRPAPPPPEPDTLPPPEPAR